MEKKSHNYSEMIARFRKLELEEAEKEKKSKEKQVCIDPDSIIGKEIKYQTALIHEILDEIRGNGRATWKRKRRKKGGEKRCL